MTYRGDPLPERQGFGPFDRSLQPADYGRSHGLDSALAMRGGDIESIIDQNSHVNGTWKSDNNLRVDGQVEGEIICTGTVIISEQAFVSATIRAQNVTVAGRLQGEVVCQQRFEILPNGQVSGKIYAKVLVVHEGASWSGEMNMHGPPPTASTGRPRRPERAPINAGEERPPLTSGSPGPAEEPLPESE